MHGSKAGRNATKAGLSRTLPDPVVGLVLVGAPDVRHRIQEATMPSKKATAKATTLLTVPRAERTAARSTKTDKALALLRRPNGVTIVELAKATRWQLHSVRGFMSGTLKKRKGLEIASEKDEKGVRRYRIAANAR